jgi:hypothetical protein
MNKENITNLRLWLKEDLPYREKHNLECALAVIDELEGEYQELKLTIRKRRKKMNKEERVKLVFETISKIAGFKIKPNKDFYIVSNDERMRYYIREDLILMIEASKDYYVRSDYIRTALPILNGDYQLEEIKEPIITDEERDFLRQFNFEKLEISTCLCMYDKDGTLANAVNLSIINFNFDGLERDNIYTRKELGL